MNAGWGISPWNLVDFTHEIWQISPRFDLWNPPKIIKASVLAKTLQFDECRVGDFTLEIQWISPWNLVDFTCEIGGFHPRFHLWNPAEFTQISSMKSTQNYKSKCFSKNSSIWWMQGGGYDQGFHKIHLISHEICQISKLWAFAWWSSIGLSFFKRPIRRVLLKHLIGLSKVKRPILDHHTKAHNLKSGGFHLKSGRFHHEIHPEPYKSDVSAKTLQFGWISHEICQISWNPLDFIWISWNPVDFMWNPPRTL